MSPRDAPSISSVDNWGEDDDTGVEPGCNPDDRTHRWRSFGLFCSKYLGEELMRDYETCDLPDGVTLQVDETT